jgi:hypothetical protein
MVVAALLRVFRCSGVQVFRTGFEGRPGDFLL